MKQKSFTKPNRVIAYALLLLLTLGLCSCAGSRFHKRLNQVKVNMEKPEVSQIMES